MAMDCFQLTQGMVTKVIRYCAKNMFVFPEFYGSFYVKCALSLWNAVRRMELKTHEGMPLLDHLHDQGIHHLKSKSEDSRNRPTDKESFEHHIYQVEQSFWHERFKVYTKWKEDQWKQYLKTGYVEFLTGFKCYEKMSKNEASNRAIQGTAFHCLLWSLIELQKRIEEKQWETLLVGQVHDSAVGDIVPEEMEDFFREAHQISSVDIREEWDWICVPLGIETELAPVGGSWFDKEEVEIV